MNVYARAAAAAALTVAAVSAAAGCGSSPKAAAPSSAPAPAASSPQLAPSTAPVSPGSGSSTTNPGGIMSPGSTANPGGTANPAAGGGSSARCHTNMLSAKVVPGQPGAGQHYAELVVTNSSGGTCRVFGYPGMQLVGASGGNVPTAVQRQPGSEPLVTLAPGRQASSLLHWTIVPGTGEGSPCEQSASGLIVTPPDETAPLHTSWPAGPVCQHGQVFVTAFQPGPSAT